MSHHSGGSPVVSDTYRQKPCPPLVLLNLQFALTFCSFAPFIPQTFTKYIRSHLILSAVDDQLRPEIADFLQNRPFTL